METTGTNIYYEDFVHNLGTKDLFVSTRDASTDEIIIVDSISFPDVNTVRIKTYDNTTDVRVTVSASASGTGTSGGGASVDDSVYSGSWDGDATTATSRNAIYDKIDAMDTTIGTNTSHITSDGSSHTFINQDVTSSATPTIRNINTFI